MTPSARACIRLLLVSFFLARSAFAQTTITLQDGLNAYAGTADTHSFVSSPLGNFGERSTWVIGWNPSEYMPLMRFAIFAGEGGPVPDGATIASATLSLNKTDGLDGAVEVRRMLRSWSELQSNWNVAATGVSWQVAGALGASDVAATAEGQGAFGAAAGWYDIDVTASVRAFAAGAPNFGWRFGQISGSNTNKTFVARDDTTAPALRPKLTINYSVTTTTTCNSGALRPYDGAPISGNPIQVASSGTTTFEAEYWNCGGEGAGYHEISPGNNAGQTFRADESVEVTAVSPSGLAVNQFDIGEWVTYSINVAAGGTYDLGVLASSSPSGGGTGAFRIEIDNVDVTGSVSVPVTTGWDDYQWLDKPGVSLTAGQHVLKLVALGTYFRTDKLRIVAASAGCNAGTSRPYSGAPVNGNPVQIAGAGATFEAEYWNCGGEGAGYHEISPGNNAGQTFRADESVEVTAAPGGLAVNQFDVNEWVAYTIDVTTAGTYDLGILTSASPSGGGPGSFRIEIDNADVTGPVTVPLTTGWDDYQWVDTPGVSVTAGQHVLKLVALGTYFRTDKLRLVPGGGTASGPDDCSGAGLIMCTRFEAAPDTRFACLDFACSLNDTNQIITKDVGGADLVWNALNKNADRADDTTRIGRAGFGRDGTNAIRFTTQDVDDNVHGSGTRERSMIQLPDNGIPYGGFQGDEQWWAHSLFLPNDWVMPTGVQDDMMIMQWNSLSIPGNPAQGPDAGISLFNQGGSDAHIVIDAWAVGAPSPSATNGGNQYWYQEGNGGTNTGNCILDNVQRNVWYDFVHHIRWSANGDAFQEIWLKVGDGPYRKVLEKFNISTLMSTSHNTYLSIGLYHSPVAGPSSVVHDRIRFGTSFEAVAVPGFPKPLGGVGDVCPGMIVLDGNFNPVN